MTTTLSPRPIESTNLKDIPCLERPRQKLLRYGPDKLSHVELLALLLGTGTKAVNVLELSRRIFKKFPEKTLVQVRPEELMSTHGIGVAKACEIMACVELGKRLLKDKKTHLYLSPRDVWEALRDIRGHRKEHFVIFYLDTNQQEIAQETISVGTLNSNIVHPREVFEPAVKHLAAQVILAHNHPSGNTEPSIEDIEVTRRLVEAGNILGIDVIDHVIVTKRGFLSLKEQRLM